MKNLKDISGAIFDFDGTLVDSMSLWDNLPIQYIKMKGYTPEEKLMESLKTLSLSEGAIYLKKKYKMEEEPAEIMKQINEFLSIKYREEVPIKEGVEELLKQWSDLGVLMCVATASSSSIAKACLLRLHILKYFQFIITCNEVGRGKEDPLIYKESLKLLKTPIHTTYVIEDAFHAIQTAKHAGFPTIAVYDKHEEDYWLENKMLADLSVCTMRELLH